MRPSPPSAGLSAKTRQRRFLCRLPWQHRSVPLAQSILKRRLLHFSSTLKVEPILHLADLILVLYQAESFGASSHLRQARHLCLT